MERHPLGTSLVPHGPTSEKGRGSGRLLYGLEFLLELSSHFLPDLRKAGVQEILPSHLSSFSTQADPLGSTKESHDEDTDDPNSPLKHHHTNF